MSRKGPLRKIVAVISLPIGCDLDRPIPGAASCGHELLECGHVQLPREDIYGPTNATRRRCWKCAANKPPKPEHLQLLEQYK